MVRIIVWLIEIILCFLLQTSVFSYFTISGVVPNCILVLVISAAYTKGQNKAIVLGFISGLILDFMSSGNLGVCAIIYMIIAYLAGFTNKIYDKNDYIIPGALVFVGEMLFSFMYYCTSFLLMGKLNFSSYALNTIIPRVIYTFISAIVIYPVFMFFEWVISFAEGHESND